MRENYRVRRTILPSVRTRSLRRIHFWFAHTSATCWQYGYRSIGHRMSGSDGTRWRRWWCGRRQSCRSYHRGRRVVRRGTAAEWQSGRNIDGRECSRSFATDKRRKIFRRRCPQRSLHEVRRAAHAVTKDHECRRGLDCPQKAKQSSPHLSPLESGGFKTISRVWPVFVRGFPRARFQERYILVDISRKVQSRLFLCGRLREELSRGSTNGDF